MSASNVHLSILSEAVSDIVDNKKEDINYIEITLYFLMQDVTKLYDSKGTALRTAQRHYSILFRYHQRLIHQNTVILGKAYLLETIPQMRIWNRIAVYLIQSMGQSVPGYKKLIRLTKEERQQLDEIRLKAKERSLREKKEYPENYHLDQATTTVRTNSKSWELASKMQMRL